MLPLPQPEPEVEYVDVKKKFLFECTITNGKEDLILYLVASNFEDAMESLSLTLCGYGMTFKSAIVLATTEKGLYIFN